MMRLLEQIKKYTPANEQEAYHWNRIYTGVELEHRNNPSMKYYGGERI